MRISDWSSDVCSSDLRAGWLRRPDGDPLRAAAGAAGVCTSRRAAPRRMGGVRSGCGRMAHPGAQDEDARGARCPPVVRSEEHTSELQSLMRISYAVFCLKKKNTKQARRKTRLSVES